MSNVEPTNIAWLSGVGIPIVTYIAGFLTSRFWPTKKEQKDIAQVNYQNSISLIDVHDKAYRVYVDAITAYVNSQNVTFDNFVKIASTGDTYFYQVSLMCDAVLSDKADPIVRDNTLLPKIKDVALELLPDHYATLSEIATTKKFDYSGELRRSDYPGIFGAVERFSLNDQ